MDILNLAQGTLTDTGLPVQAEPIAGQVADIDVVQTPAAFSDALLNVIDSLMVGQSKTTRGLTVSAQPASLDEDDENIDAQPLGDSLLKNDSQQRLLETLLMTSQMPVHTPALSAVAQPVNEALIVNAQPLAASALLSSRQPSTLLQQNVPAPIPTAGVSGESPVNLLVGSQPIAPALMTVMVPVTPTMAETSSTPSFVKSAVVSPLFSTLKLDPEPSRWSEQLQSALGDRLQVQVKQQIQHATIRLDPPDMGKIDISMQVDNGRVQVQINASHAEVYRALQQTSNDLRQSLTEQNFVQVNVQVSSQSGGQQQGRGQPFAEQHNAILAGAELTASTTAAQDSRSDDSVLLTV